MGKFYAGIGEQLKLHVRHLAWLQATPQDKGGKKSVTSGMTRLQILNDKQDRGDEPEGLILPPVDCGMHLVEYLFRCGPTSPEGGAVSFQEITAWAALSGVLLEPWEAETIRSLSGAFAGESFEAKDGKRLAPFIIPKQLPREVIANRVAAAFRSIKPKGHKAAG